MTGVYDLLRLASRTIHYEEQLDMQPMTLQITIFSFYSHIGGLR